LYKTLLKSFIFSKKVYIFVLMSLKRKTECGNRDKQVTFSLNDKEHALIDAYIKKYKIENRSRWFRETIISFILKNLDQDYPTLFDENEMRR